MQKRLSIRDIAARSGVSVSTVSRVLNQNGYVAEETAQKVRAVIEEVNFMPSAAARELRGSSTPMVGILVPDNIGEFFLDVMTALQKELQKKGYESVLVSSEGTENIRETYLYMQNRLNLVGWFHIMCEPFVEKIEIPTVIICWQGSRKEKNLAYVTCNDLLGGYQAAEELIRAGCRRIACLGHARQNVVLPMPRAKDDNIRQRGAANAMRANGLEVIPELMMEAQGISYQDGFDCAQQLLNVPDSFDGIFCMADRYVPGAVEAIYQRGLRIPEDIKVVGYGDNPISHVICGGFTTVRIELDELADAAIDSFLDMREGKIVEDKITGVSLIRRNTT